ncbi:hypothetical protein K6U06_14830 [Acidiferrimicrobium sp. IK]|uniref:hypothetical protein n=1 Tax=Acidiferrimicrobium sp. IK TaxID=2871700 RepID=UPI0021CB43D4|nr:hypothetical protein [Acidiferrimicrobium sp. IK]MCU4185640.1 hypothetical protein [Acidiferrimicrobium sp. IK]
MGDDDRTAEWRAELERDFGLYSTGDVARRAGSRGHSPATAVKRWAAAGKIFAVASAAGVDVYPGFCFDVNGRPHPAIAAVVKASAGRLTGWSLAGWFVTPNSRLGGARPVDHLEQVDALAAAAAAARADPAD